MRDLSGPHDGLTRTSRWFGRPARSWRPHFDHGARLAPGLLLCGVIGMAAAFIELRWGGPRVLFALLMGMAFHEFSSASRQRPGVDFAAQTLLRLGIGLLGARIALHDVAALGWPTIALVALAVGSTLGCVALVARLGGMPWRIGMIAGGATAICGASAALAIAAALPRDRISEQRTLTIVVCATTLSTLAMLSYPLVCAWLALPPRLSGLVLGGSIHDVAQVAVAGYAMGHPVGDMAIVVKLMRVAMLTLVVAAIAAGWRHHARHAHTDSGTHVADKAAAHAETGSTARPPSPAWLPWFMCLFLILAVLQSLRWLPPTLAHGLADMSQTCLAVAAAGLGMRSSVGLLRQAGWRVLLPMLIGSVWLAATMLGGGLLLGVR